MKKMIVDSELIEKFFLFTDGYNAGKEKIELKRIHSLATANIMNYLTEMKGLDERFRYVAYTCGVVHDLGRFNQIYKFDSYNDESTLDHGELGYQILKETDFLDKLDDKEKKMVLDAVRYHNKIEIPLTVPKDSLLMCKLIRDADKIDNFRVNVNEELSDEIIRKRLNRQVLSKEVFECMSKHKMTPFEIRKNELDEYVGSLSYFYDMYFKESFILSLKQGYVQKLCSLFSPIDKTSSEMINQIISDLKQYINEIINQQNTNYFSKTTQLWT